MKKISTCLLLIALFMLGANRVTAQTNVAISYHYESLAQSCVMPASWSFYIAAEAVGYTAADSADIFIDFGDGNDTTVKMPLYFYNSTYATTSLSNYIPHTYTVQGLYPVQYIVTLPDANADTLIANATATTACNNVTGRIYVDINADCIYNTGDLPIQYENVKLRYNSGTVTTTNSDAVGQFTMTAAPGYTYTLGVDGLYSPIPNFTCGTFQDMPVTVSPSINQDLVASNTTAITIGYAGDSLPFAGSCIPYNSYLYIQGSALNYNPLVDSIDIYVNFGDGDDTTYTAPLFGTPPTSTFYATVNHIYTSTGSFNVMYIATGPDANADTLIHYNEIIVNDTCGNVEGNVYIDNNNNCIRDTGDSTNIYLWVSLTQLPSGYQYYACTDVNGHYSFSVPQGNYTVSILSNFSYVSLTPTCPSSGTANVVVTASNTVVSDFAVICPSSYDLSGWLSISHGIFPTSTGRLYPFINNQSCTTTPGSVTLILDPLVNYVGVCDPAFTPTVNGDTLTWNFTSLNAYMNWYYWYSYQGCIEVIGDPALQLGDSVCFTMIVNPIAGDANPANNTYTRCVPALVSLDPNIKNVSPKGSGPLGYVPQNTTFDYMIEFQNTGTTAARDIFILDSLDADLDISTLVVTGSSHFMQPQILPGNVLKINYNDIWLADSTSNEAASHGWVSYSIKAKSNLAPLTPIQNTAGIYFDFNAPVMTNSTLNTVTDPSSVNELSTNEVAIFPNPASSTVQIILSKEANAVYTLTDLAGKIVFSAQMQGRNATLNVSALPQGVYLLNVVTENGTSTHKIIVQH